MTAQALELLSQLQDAWIKTTIKSEVLTTLSIHDAIDNPQRLNEAHEAVRIGTENIKKIFNDLQRELKRELLADDTEMLDMPGFLRREAD